MLIINGIEPCFASLASHVSKRVQARGQKEISELCSYDIDNVREGCGWDEKCGEKRTVDGGRLKFVLLWPFAMAATVERFRMVSKYRRIFVDDLPEQVQKKAVRPDVPNEEQKRWVVRALAKKLRICHRLNHTFFDVCSTRQRAARDCLLRYRDTGCC